MNPTPTEIPQFPSSPPISAHISTSPPPPTGGPPKFPLFPILAGIILMIIVATGAFLLGKSQNPPSTSNPQPTTYNLPPSPSPTPDPTADWKIYTNTEYRFSVKHPPKLSFVEQKSDTSLLQINFAPLKDESSPYFSIQVKKPDKPENIIQNIKAQIVGHITDKITSQQLDPHGFSGLQYDYTTLEGKQRSTVIITNNYYFYVIEADTNSIDQILSTFKFLDKSNSATNTPIKTPQANGAILKEIRYTLPNGWTSKLYKDGIDRESLMISPENGGYISILEYTYPGNIGRREYYCQIWKVCIDSTYFTETQIGNISGYHAYSLDNSGGGELFGAKGNKFYVISVFNPPSPNEFEKNYQKVLDSLIF